MAESDVQRRANRAYLSGHLDNARSAALDAQLANTKRAYKKAQRDFKVSSGPASCTEC